MDRYLILLCHLLVVVALCLQYSTPGALADEAAKTTVNNTAATSTTPPTVTKPNKTESNKTGSLNGTWRETFTKNKDMLKRALYVIIGVTAVVILYFVVRAWRSKRRRNKSRKYGLITNDTVEMEPLDRDVDDDDDMTVFEQNNKFK